MQRISSLQWQRCRSGPMPNCLRRYLGSSLELDHCCTVEGSDEPCKLPMYCLNLRLKPM